MSPQHLPDPAPPLAPEALQQAADLFEARQNGADEPEGTWVDRVWLPSDAERRSCCAGLEPDRLKDPQKLRFHCRTLLHAAHRFEVDSRLLRAEIKRRRQAREGAAQRQSPAAPAAPVAPAAMARRRGGRRGRPPRGLMAGAVPVAETQGLDATLFRLIAGKDAELQRLAAHLYALTQELHQQVEDNVSIVEVAVLANRTLEVAEGFTAQCREMSQLLITRSTLRRVLG